MASQREEFEEGFAAAAASTKLPALMRAGFPDLPDWARTFSFVPASGLLELGTLLRLDSRSLLLDVACGMGGPGQIVAEASGARLVGIDYAVPAVVKAAQVAEGLTTVAATFAAASGDALPFADGSVDAVMCIDALRFIPGFGFPEIIRVLRPGGRMGVTLWERFPEGDEPGLPDVAALLAGQGLQVEHVSRHDDWLDAQESVYDAAIRARDAGDADMIVGELAAEGERVMGKLDRGRRVMAVGVKPGRGSGV